MPPTRIRTSRDKTRTTVSEWLAIATFVSKVIAAIVLFAILAKFRQPLMDFLHHDVRSVSAFGVQLDIREAQRTANRVARKLKLAGAVEFDSATVEELRARAGRVDTVIAGRRMLWLDDRHPINNTAERLLLNSFGIFVDPVAKPSDAIWLARSSCYDVVVTDITEGDDPQAGFRFADSLRAYGVEAPVVAYTLSARRDQGVPIALFDIANTPGDFINDVIDALERSSNPACSDATRRSGNVNGTVPPTPLPSRMNARSRFLSYPLR
jgi:hypothetical protein